MTPFRETNRITSPYGWRTYTNAAGKTIREHHNGIDVVPTRYAGEDVAGDAWDFREVTGGRVIEVSTGWNSGRGTLIKVQTAPGVIEFYQHCAAVYVKVGQQVPQGTVLGRAGATGNVTGAHLHFEVQVNGSPVEPSAWLGLPNAGGTYPGDDTLDKPAEAEDYVHGIDVSKYQGSVDWAKVAASGVKFSILRAGSSTNSGPYVDPTFEDNYKGCRENGIAVGAYIFTYATNDTEQDAELAVFLPALRGKTFEYPVFVDVEDKSLTGIGKAALTRLAKRHMDIIRQNGFAAGWYSYTNFINNYLNAAELADYPLWVADYRASLGYSGQYAMWQYTSSGNVPGISGAVDLNRDYHRFCDATTEQPAELDTIQLVTLAPLTDDEMRLTDALAAELGLPDDGRYKAVRVDDTHFAAAATMTTGDAMRFLALAQQQCWDKQGRYHARFVG